MLSCGACLHAEARPGKHRCTPVPPNLLILVLNPSSFCGKNLPPTPALAGPGGGGAHGVRLRDPRPPLAVLKFADPQREFASACRK